MSWGWTWQWWLRVCTMPWCVHTAHTSQSSSAVSVAGTSAKGSVRYRGEGLSRGSLFAGKSGREMLLVVKLWSSTHHLRWAQGPEIPPNAAERLTQPCAQGDTAPASQVLVCRSHTKLPMWNPTELPFQDLEQELHRSDTDPCLCWL